MTNVLCLHRCFGSARLVDKIGDKYYSLLLIFSIVFILSAPCSPIFGYVVDRLGYNVLWVIFGVVCSLGTHGLLSFTYLNPWVGMVINSYSYLVIMTFFLLT